MKRHIPINLMARDEESLEGRMLDQSSRAAAQNSEQGQGSTRRTVFKDLLSGAAGLAAGAQLLEQEAPAQVLTPVLL